MNKFLFLLVALTLVGCSTPVEEKLAQNQGWVEVGNSSFSIKIPQQIIKKIERKDGSWAYLNYNDITYKRNAGDYAIHVYGDTSPVFYYSCDLASIIDSRLIEDQKDTKTIIGRIPDPPCQVDKCDNSKFGYSEFKGRHVLCSEHEEKIARIEINQAVDDPTFAEQIFSTFKWVE